MLIGRDLELADLVLVTGSSVVNSEGRRPSKDGRDEFAGCCVDSVARGDLDRVVILSCWALRPERPSDCDAAVALG